MTKSTKKKASARFAPETSTRRTAAIAATAVGGLAAGLTAALKLGWLDRFFGGVGAAGGAEHAAPDLAADAPTPGTERAPDAFRPDPTAPVGEAEREALRPATGSAPSMAATAGEMANQTGAAG
ncbi:hypothetical protein [Sphingomonas adhaesiva]|uniref:hypothetical protein n=1 Tax=Sphingomonas adhaesiva TaxID=28212 RepID=UPI002FF7BB97